MCSPIGALPLDESDVYVVEENMMSTKCSSHFIEAYGDYKRSLWRTQEEERLKQMRVNGRFVMPNYEDDDRRHSLSAYDQIALKKKCPQIDALIEEENEEENKDSEDKCVWHAELQGKRPSVYTASLSASNLERLQQLAVRRSTLPENVFSKLRDKCKEIKSQRTVHTVAYEEDEEEIENNVFSDTCIAEEEADLPEETKLLIRRSRKLSVAMQHKPRERKTKFEEIMSRPFNERKISFPDIKTKINKNDENGRRRHSGVITKTPAIKTSSNERNKTDVNESSQFSSNQVSHSTNSVMPQLRKNGTINAQADINNNNNNNNNNMCTKASSNKIPTDINIPHPKRNTKFNTVYNSKQQKEEKKTNPSIEELKSCRYLRSEVLANTCTCNTCERRKTICKNCKTSKKLEF